MASATLGHRAMRLGVVLVLVYLVVLVGVFFLPAVAALFPEAGGAGHPVGALGGGGAEDRVSAGG